MSVNTWALFLSCVVTVLESQDKSGETYSITESAPLSDGPSVFLWIPRRIVFERGSSMAIMCASPTLARKPSSVDLIAVG